MSLLKDIQELTEKANKYDNVRARYVQHSEKLKAIIGQLNGLLSEIDPGSVLTNNRRSGFNYKDELTNLYNLMRGGTRISRPFLEKAYSDLDSKKFNYMLNTLREMHKVQHVRKGKFVEVYLLKEE